MRDYARVHPSFWFPGGTGQDLAAVSADLPPDVNADAVRVLAFHLMTCPSMNMIGLYYQPLPMIMAELQWPEDKLRAALWWLGQKGFAHYDEARAVMFLPRGAAFQVGEVLKPKDNMRKKVVKQLQPFADHPFGKRFVELYREPYHLHEWFPEPDSNSGGVSEVEGSETPPRGVLPAPAPVPVPCSGGVGGPSPGEPSAPPAQPPDRPPPADPGPPHRATERYELADPNVQAIADAIAEFPHITSAIHGEVMHLAELAFGAVAKVDARVRPEDFAQSVREAAADLPSQPTEHAARKAVRTFVAATKPGSSKGRGKPPGLPRYRFGPPEQEYTPPPKARDSGLTMTPEQARREREAFLRSRQGGSEGGDPKGAPDPAVGPALSLVPGGIDS